MEDSPLFGDAGGPEGRDQAFFSEISEHDIEVLHQREQALVQIEVRTPTLPLRQLSSENRHLSVCLSVSLGRALKRFTKCFSISDGEALCGSMNQSQFPHHHLPKPNQGFEILKVKHERDILLDSALVSPDLLTLQPLGNECYV